MFAADRYHCTLPELYARLGDNPTLEKHLAAFRIHGERMEARAAYARAGVDPDEAERIVAEEGMVE